MNAYHACNGALLLLLTGCGHGCEEPVDHTEEEVLAVTLTGLGADCAGEGEEAAEGYAAAWRYALDASGEVCEIAVTFEGPLFSPGLAINDALEQELAASGGFIGAENVALEFERAAFEGRSLRLSRAGTAVDVPAEDVDITLNHPRVSPLLSIAGEGLASLEEAEMTGITLESEEGEALAAVFYDLWQDDAPLEVEGDVALRLPMSALPDLAGEDLAVALTYAWTVEGTAHIGSNGLFW